MHRSNRFLAFAICAACCLAAIWVAQLHLNDASEDAVARSMRYDVAWMGVNGRLEAAHLEKHVARFAALGEEKDAEAARLFYEILRGRMDLWDAGGFERFIARAPKRRDRYEALRNAIDSLATDMDRLDEPDARRRVLETLKEAAPIIDRLGAEAHSESVAEAATVRNELQDKQRLQRALISLLLLSGTVFLIFMVVQNGSLHAAHLATTRQAEKLSFLAEHDALTDLPNRRAFDTALKSAQASRTVHERIAVAAVDLDGFKAINDTLGHAAGDALLLAVSHRLLDATQERDHRNVVCRIGGDEFLVLFWLEKEPTEPACSAQWIAELFKAPFDTTFGTMMVGATVGIAFSDEGAGVDVIQNADLALTEAKARGKGGVLPFDRQMRTDHQRRLRIEADLDAALEDGQIVPHYQPQFDLVSGRPTGVEALARWSHPRLGSIPPGEFIPIAESSGAVVRLGRQILRTACLDAVMLPDNIGVSVNLSVIQVLKDDIVSVVRETLAISGLAPERLTLEITESAMMTDPDTVLAVLSRLKAIGVSIALDDFGTGYSALAYLTRFAWDELKIDRSFIKSASRDTINLLIIRAVRMLAQRMDARVTVEGVETPEQSDLLRKIGCDTAQGYLFGRPVSRDELMPFLLNHCATALESRDSVSKSGVPAVRQGPSAS